MLSFLHRRCNPEIVRIPLDRTNYMEIHYIQSSGWQNTDSHGDSTLWSISGSDIVTNREGLPCTGPCRNGEGVANGTRSSHLP